MRQDFEEVADFVILAISCFIYKDILFSEEVLSKERVSNISVVEMGRHLKIILDLDLMSNGMLSSEFLMQGGLLSIFDFFSFVFCWFPECCK